MLHLLIFPLSCLVIADGRDMGKTLRTMPVVTNSLVNLGKMDISFYFNARPQDPTMTSDLASHSPNSFLAPRSEPVITEPCPCSSFKYMRDSTQEHPSDLLSKILSGNDLFSFKEPTSSTLCCDSHENVHEDILLEFSPKQSQVLSNSQQSFPLLPFILESIQNKPPLPTMPVKTKAVEFFFFPKKRGPTMVINKLMANKKDFVKKDIIKIVGDKEIRNDFKTKKFVPPFISSVKKDLADQEKSKHTTKNVENTSFTVDNKSNTV